jgi:hypothetical protein
LILGLGWRRQRHLLGSELLRERAKDRAVTPALREHTPVVPEVEGRRIAHLHVDALEPELRSVKWHAARVYGPPADLQEKLDKVWGE